MAEIIYWKDFDNEFNRKANGDVREMTNIDAIYNSLTNIFETFQGSRRMLPEFAINLHSYLYEPVDEITSYKIGEIILDALERWETRIIVDNVEVIARPDSNEYRINVEFRIANDAREGQTQIFSDVLRAA